MADPAAPADAFAVPRARDAGFTDIEAARIISHFLHVTERKLGMPENCACQGWDEHIKSILVAARGGRLDAGEYRTVWEIWRAFSRRPGADPESVS